MTDRSAPFRRPAALSLAIALLHLLPAAGAQEAYRKPPEVIVKMLEAPAPPAVSLSPDGRWMLIVEREEMAPISEFTRPMARVAGMRLDPKTNGPHGPRRFVGIVVKDVREGAETRVELPEESNVEMPSWSPDSARFAFTITTGTGIELWCGMAKDATARRLTGPILNACGGGAFEWMPDGRTLLCRTIPVDRGPIPEESPVPAGPVTQETAGRGAPVRTYQDLLEDAHDEAMFEWLCTAQLALVDSASGRVSRIGRPAIVRAEPSPDGNYLLVDRTERPYSYLVPMGSFPTVTEVWDMRGQVVKEIARHGILDAVPIGGVQTGPRGIGWRATAPATLFWTEALDDGDPKKEVEHRDRVMAWSAPFEDDAVEVLRTPERFSGLRWLEDGRRALVSDFDRDRRWNRTWLYEIDGASRVVGEARLVWDMSSQDRYNDPGRPQTTLNEFGRSVVRVDEGMIWLTGSGASVEGDRPFLDRMSLGTFETERLWRCEGEVYESVVEVLEGEEFMTRRESPTEPPNYFLRHASQDRIERLTDFPDPQPEMRGVRKELVTYQRDDGVELSATLYLPADYREGTRLPLLVWAYPREFNDPGMAGQVSGSPYRFTRVGGASHLFLVTQGYAIMDGATMPVVGSDPETVNDTFIEQIVASAKAAIEKAASMGVADPDRAAVGGHSYGAFMTANLLAHSDLFKAGIARSGAYNRTLTPFGFQSERRTFWEAPEVYFALSPFMHADRINEPILLIHGMMDNNSGTFPMQSERLYAAVKAHGGTARLVMLPHESHGYQSKESVMHVLAEMIDWLDRHVKNASPGGAGGVAGADDGGR